MTGGGSGSRRRRPPRQPGADASRSPRARDDVPELSEEEVARRVDVRGGGPGLVPPPLEHSLRDRRPGIHARRAERPGRPKALDALLLLGLALVGIVALSILLPRGPLTSSATTAPSATGTGPVAVASGAGPSVVEPSQTGGLITLPPPTGPTPDPAATVAPVIPSTPSATAAPGPTGTPRPGSTPRVTSKPPTNPPPTATPTQAPTPGTTATVVVIMNVVNNSGGAASASDWTMRITGEVGSNVSPNNFPGSASGTTVTIKAGLGYLVSDNGAVAGYAVASSAGCSRSAGSGGLAAGTSVTCTITRNDRPRVRVITEVVNDDGGGASPGDWNVTVSGGAVPSSFSGTSAGRIVVVTPGVGYVVSMSGPAGYAEASSGACSDTLGLNDAQVTCTVTFNDDEPPPTDPPPTDPPETDPPLPAPIAGLLLVPALLPARRGRPWIRTPNPG